VSARGRTPNAPVEVPGAATVFAVALAQPVSKKMARWRGAERTIVDVAELDIDHGVPGGRISATHITTPAHAGTHIDAARHFFPAGKTIDEYPVARFVRRGIALDVRRDGPVALTADELRALDPGVGPGDAVLLYFGYAERYEKAEYYDHPYLSADAAAYLVDRQVGLVGVDLLTPDSPAERRPARFTYPVHSQLLGADILIIENLGPGLARLLGRWFLLVFAPIRLEDADGSPVAPVALVGDGVVFPPGTMPEAQ
jgi:arylformamidase